VLLDGAVGTELSQRGVGTEGPRWSANAILSAPDVLTAIHRDYVAAGATVHTAATFRTKHRAAGREWNSLSEKAVALARAAIPREHRVAGSIAPLEDCYRPDLAPSDRVLLAREHGEFAQALVAAGVDLLLAETFASPAEAIAATEACVATGTETWTALTAGPDGDLLSPEALADAAKQCARAGASAVLVNCVAASKTDAYVDALARLGICFGAYANAGEPKEGIGWGAGSEGALRYAALARRWLDAGATIIGGCCGTGPAHIEAVARLLAANHE
jgi:S-methylmethionine-dependent homocysteine/selenocysteine methylase